MIDYAIELGHEVIAFTNHETVSNALKIEKYYNKIKKDHPNFKVIRGNEIYLVRNDLTKENFVRGEDNYYHFILLAKDAIGHQQIREISTRAWMRSWKTGKMRRVPTYYQDLEDIIGTNPGHVIGSTACFREGTMVETKSGWKPIEQIKSGDYVVNQFGNWEEVIEPTCNWFDGVMYKIDFLGSSITCTDNHQFLTITNNSKIPKWVQAKDLRIKRGASKHICLRPFQKNYPYAGKTTIQKKEFLHSYFKDSVYSHKTYSLPEVITITPELMRLFGLFLGDGCLSLEKTPRLIFTLNDKEFYSYNTSFIKAAGEQLGINWSILHRPEHHTIDIVSASCELIDLFYWLFGKVKADTKYIPERLKINDELSYELIFGYFLADGYFRVRKPTNKVPYSTGEYVSVSISKKLSYDFYELLNSLGIATNIRKKDSYIGADGTHHKDSWYLDGSNKFLGEINKENIYYHKDIIDIFSKAIEYKKKDFVTINDIFYKKIRIRSKKEQRANEYVYCLNNTTHSFKCENVIVHNCLGGVIPTQILKWGKTDDEKLYEAIKKKCLYFRDIFGEENFFLELQPSNESDQKFVNTILLTLSKELSIPAILTTDSHYLKKSEAPIHSAFLRAQEGDREVDSFYATTYMMSDEEIREYIDEYISEEDIQEMYRNIIRIKDMCEDYTLKKPLKIPILKWKIPEYVNVSDFYDRIPLLEELIKSPYESDTVLAQMLVSKLQSDSRLCYKESYDEINSNIEMIIKSSEVNKAEWSAYLLNLQNIIDVCWRAGTIVAPGRGSGVGFYLLYLLDITQVNPLWETTRTFAWRFLNPNRVSVLDIDFDISGLRRDEILKAFRKEYGEDRVSNVATFGTEKSKSAILTAARGLGIDVDLAQYIASMVPADRGLLRSLKQCYYGDVENDFSPIPEFVREMDANPELWEVAQKIEGLICRMGSHAGGVIFVDEPFTNSTALMRTPDGTIVTQFDLHDCEDVSRLIG